MDRRESKSISGYKTIMSPIREPNHSETQCRVCLVKGFNKEITIKMDEIHDPLRYAVCPECNSISLLTNVDEEKIYNNDYYSLQDVNFMKKGFKSLMKRVLYRTFTKSTLKGGLLVKLADRLTPSEVLKAFAFIDPGKEASILDVGSGSGDFLFRLHLAGYTKLTGLDPNITSGTVNSVKFIGETLNQVTGTWDIITMNHSIEHVLEPSTILQKARTLLNSNGKLLIRTPVIPSFGYFLRHEKWYAFSPPFHKFVASYEGLQLLLHQNGFRILKSWRDMSPNNLRELGISGDHKNINRVTAMLNQHNIGDCVAIVAEAVE